MIHGPAKGAAALEELKLLRANKTNGAQLRSQSHDAHDAHRPTRVIRAATGAMSEPQYAEFWGDVGSVGDFEMRAHSCP